MAKPQIQIPPRLSNRKHSRTCECGCHPLGVTIELGNHMSDVGSFEEHLRGFNDANNKSNCMKDGIMRR